MKILSAEFITSSDCFKNCPDFDLPEIAMIGRSNVGKSSFINTITGRKKLAKTSNTPGKTRLINFYKINNKLIIVDLPGYGYAKLSKTEQQKWKKTLEEYLICRKSLKAVIQLIDSRHEVQNNDFKMRDWLNYHKIFILTVATKIDTLSKIEGNKSIENISKSLNTEIIPFSAKTGIEKNKILELLFNL
ncbi:MAG: ribosome biogenesis GTP-binding protein YihA/YsxC [bacterium]